MKKILVIGHSHIHALKNAQTANETFEFHSMPPATKIVDTLSELERQNYNDFISIIFLIDGNYHNIFGLVNTPISFDFYLPENLDLALKKDSQLLPVSLVSKVIERNLMPVLNFRDKLSQFFKGIPIYEIESPPPLPEEHIKKYPHPFSEKIDQFGISPTAFRYKLWRLHSKIIHKNCENLGITFIEVPKETQDSDGLLREKYLAFDATHANKLYGDLILNKIRAIHNIESSI